MSKTIRYLSVLVLLMAVLFGCGKKDENESSTASANRTESMVVTTGQGTLTNDDTDPSETEPTAASTASPSTDLPETDELPAVGDSSTAVTDEPQTPQTGQTALTTVKDGETGAPVTEGQPVTDRTPVSTTPVGTTTPDERESVTVVYKVESTVYGKIVGTANQTIYRGETTTSAVTAKAAVGYRFVGWSDGVKSATRSGESPAKNMTVTALFEIEALELPVVHITTSTGREVTSKEEYIDGTIAISNCDAEYELDTMDMEIRGRGNYTWTSNKVPKKSYRIKLSKKQNLLGQGSGKAKVWTLIANHCDQSLLRNYTTLNYGRKLDGIAFMSSAQSVDVYFNGEYRGVYLLCEQIQVNEERVDITEAPNSVNTGYLIEMTGYAEDPKFEMYLESGWFNFEIKNDLSADWKIYDEQIIKAQTIMDDAWVAIQGGDRDTIESLIDIDSAVDTYIVEELFKNLDAGWDSFYFYYDAAVAGEKLHFGPIWDFDLSGGNVDEPTGCDQYTGLRAGEIGCNPWYAVLLRQGWFRQLVADRWNELKHETDKIPGDIITAAKAGYNAYCRNFEKWQIFGQQINREPAVIRALDSYTEHYEYYAQWMTERIAWLDSYFNGIEYSFDGKLTLKGSGTKSNPYQVNTANDFLNFTLCMKTGETFEGKYFIQTANLDLTTLADYSGVGASATFAGVYDGCGHTIKAVLSGNDECIFPYLTGTIMNLMTEGSITNNAQAAGICRSVRVGGVVINCASTMTLSGSFAGGIAASNETGGGMILNCYFAGTVDGYEAASPINCYFMDRGGTYLNNYYLNTVTHTTADAIDDENETALSESDMRSKLADNLNDGLSEAASYAGVSVSDLCEWQTVSGKMPQMKTK